MTGCINQLRHYGGIIRHGTTNRLARSNLVLLILLAMILPTRMMAGTISGTFSTLTNCPMNLTCFTVDPTTGYFYGQGDQSSTNYYRYNAGTNSWTTLASSPQTSGNNGGATYLNGKIYNSYCSYTTIAVYTIATNSWTTISGGVASGSISTDGTDIYVSGNGVFKKYVVSSGTWVSLTATACQPWGGLQYKNGYFYLHVGNGQTGFKRYNIATDTWADLTAVPGGAVLGSAIYDAYYYCQGSYGGTNLYSYDLGQGAWNNTLTLPFTTNDAAIVTYGNSLYIVQGEAGTGFTKFTPNNPLLMNMEGTALNYTIGGAATNITATLTASQNAGTNFASATVSITSGFQTGKDVLSFVNANGITGSWNSTTGVLTLTGTTTIANYQAALRAIKYSNVDLTSNSTTRVISYQVYDGSIYSNTASRSIIPITAPSVTTNDASAITYNTATSGGNVTSDGNSSVTARGVCWSTSPAPTTSNNKTVDGSGSGVFTSSLTGLSTATTYYIRAYATNSLGTAYGIEKNFTTTKQNQTITFTALPVKVVGDVDFNPGATASSGLTVTYASSNTAVATIVDSKIHIIGVGTSIITASQVGDATYNVATPVQQTLTVNKANQTISFSALPNKVVGDADFAPGATASSGLTVTYASSNTAVATITAGGLIHIVSNGTSTITASQAGNANYNAATSVQQTLNVNHAPPVLITTVGSGLLIRNAAPVVIDAGLTVTSTQDITGARISIGSYQSGDVLSWNAGSVPSGVSGSFSSTTGVLTFSGTATAAQWQTLLRTVTIATTSSTTTQRVTTFALGTSLPLDVNGHYYEYVASQSGIDWSGANIAANAKKLFGMQGYLATVTGSSENDFIADKLGGNGWIGASDATVEGTWRWITGPEGLEASGAGRNFYTGQAPTGAVIGTNYAHWYSGEPNNAGNEDYAHFYSSGLQKGYWNDFAGTSAIAGYVVEYGGMTGDPTLQISGTKALDVKLDQIITFATPTAKTYGDADFASGASSNSGLTATLTSSDPAVATVSGLNIHVVKAGNCTITASQAGNGTYVAATDVVRTLTINPKTLTAAVIGNPTKNYNGNANATLTSANYSFSGLVGSESFTITKTSGSYALKDAGTRVVSVSLVAGDFTATNGAIAANYTLPATASGNGTISAAALTAAVIGNPTKTYNGNTNATLSSANYSLSGLVGSESFTVTKTAGSYALKDAGTRNITVSLVAGDFTPGNGAIAANYTLPATASGNGTISAAALTAAVIGTPTKNYDGNTNATLSSANYSLTGLVSPESFTVTKTTGIYANATAGPRNVTVSLASGDFTPANGAVAANYTLPTTASGSGTINQATPVVQTNPSATSIVTGQALSSSTLSGGVVTGAGGAVIPGTFSFVTPTVIPPGGNYIATVIFTPTDVTNYTTITFTITVDVKHITSFAAGTHGALSGTLTQNISQNASSTAITANADAGYKFDSWTVNSGSGNATVNLTANPLTITDVTGPISLTANFIVDPSQTFAVTVTAGANGTLGANYNGNYAVETPISITAVPNAGYMFNGWTGNTSVLANPNSATTTLTVTAAAANLTANFIVDPSQTFAVTVTAGANGALGANYNGNYAVETPISITAVPNTGYMFNGWTGNTSVLANPNSATTTLTVTAAAANLTANFIVDPSQTYAVTVTAGANGTLGANYNGNYAVETPISITAVPNAGYMFNGWTGNTSVLANPNSATTTLTVTAAAANLTANFIVDPSQLFAVTVTAGANGTLGGNYNGTYPVETQIPITAVPNAGYMFANWTGDTSVLANPNSATTTLTVTANTANLTANFIVDPSQLFAVSVTAGANGTLGANYNGNYAVETQIPITAIPNAGYMFANWTGDTSVLANPNSATTTLTVTAAAANLTANFIVDPSQTFAVSVTAGANGTLGANYNGNYAVETQIPITAVPNAGYMFNGWTGNTSVLADPNSATTTLTVTAAAVNLTANFIVDPSQFFALNLTLGAHGTSVTGAGNYNAEHVQTITAVAATGYRFKNWTGDVTHVANVNSATTTVTQPASTVNLTASFEIDYGQTFALNATAGDNGSLAANYNGNYNTGSQVTLTAVPAVGYKFLNWTGNVSSLSSTTTATATLIMPSQNVNLTANFVVENEQLFALGLTLGAGGTAVVGAGNYPVTHQQQISATAAAGYKFKNWTGDVAVITTGTANDAAVTVTMPAQATALTANFEVDPAQLYSLSVLSNNTQFGTASDLTNTAPYNVNTIVNIKAVPKTGYRFTGWVSSNGGSFGNATTAETTFEMPAKAVILTASFEVDPAQLFALTVNADANGTLGANYNGNYTVGTQMNLTAIPNTGYKFLNWTGDVAYIGNNSKSTTVTLTMPAAAVNLVANFVPETSTLFALNTTLGAGGASVTGAGSYPVDHQQQLVAHAAIGYKFKTWTGDTGHIITGLATDAIVTVKMPAAVINLTATFEIDQAQTYTLSLVSTNLQMGTVIDETATGPYTLGSVVNIKAVPTAGHRFTGWVSSNGGTIGNDFSAATTFTMPANNVLLTAGFEVDDGQTFALNVSAAPHGSLATNYNGYYHVETVKNISAAGDTGYRFKEWTGDVANISAGTVTDSAVTVTMPATAVALVAGFEVDPNQFFALNLTLGAHGTSVSGAGNYNIEHVQTITAVAATGYKFANWTGDVTNVADVNSATTTITMPASAVNLTANFVVDQTQIFALNLTLGEHGLSVTGAGNYNAEHIQTITAVAATGYKFANWTGDVTNVADVNSATTTITMPANAVNLTANFIVDQTQTFALNLTLGAHGVSVTGAGNYYAEHIQTITAVAATGYKFANWTGDVTNVADVNSATTTITMPASAANLTANFIVDEAQTFAVSVTAGANGTLGANYNGNYAVETQIPIIAIPNTGYMFNGWTGNTSVLANPNSATTTLTVTAAAANLTANFIVDEAQTFALSLAANPATYGNASLASGQAAGPYNAGTVVNVKAVANTGFKFVNWTKPDKTLFATATKNTLQKSKEIVSTLPEFGYTMTAANTALTSNFKVDSAQTFALNITMSTGGQSVTGAGSYVVLHQQSITAVAAAGYQFKNWTGDISAVANANSATTTVTMPSATVNLTANFEMIVPILAVSTDYINYENIIIGDDSVKTVKIYNAGASTLVGSIAEVSSPFSFVQTKNNRIKARMQKNRLSFELGMTDTLRLNVKFKPQDINSFLDTMLVTSNGSGISEKSVILQGSATADPNSEPVLTLWPDSLIYGSMLVNTSREKKFNLKNNGGKVLTGYIRFPVEHQSVYLSTAKNNSKAGRAILDSVAFSLTSGSVATYASLFTPDSARNYLENISVVSNDLTATGRRNIKVTATGLANGVTLSKNLIDFGKVRVGVAKDSTIMVKNNTAEPFVIYGIKGMNYGTTAAFTSADSNGVTIAANDSAAVNFKFKPQFPTAYRDTAKIFYNAEMTKYLPVYLAGTGEYTGLINGKALVIKPIEIDYGIIATDNLYKGHFTVFNKDTASTVVGFSLNFDNKYIRVIEQGSPVAKAGKKGGKDYYFYYLHNGDSINFEVQLTMNSFAAAQITGEQFLSKVWLYSNATSNPNQFVTLKGRTGAVEPGLSAFSLLSPADNHKPYANNIDLSWQSAKNATISGDVEYTAYIITPTDSIALPTTATTVNSGKQLKFNQKYEWTVKAKYGYQEKWANEKWSFELQQKGDATPNPFTPDSRDPNFATTKFDIFDKEADLSVKIYSIGGKFISHVTLIKQIDRWTASWDGKNRNGDIVGPGVYLYQVYTGNKVLRNGFIGVIR